MIDGFEPASLDPRSWYHVASASTGDIDIWGLSSDLYFGDASEVTLEPATTVAPRWQFEPVDDTPGRYAIRLSKTGIAKQLSVCHVEDEADDSRTRPCMAVSGDGQEQQWDVAALHDGSYRFVNVRNGSDYHLDTHMESGPFMRSTVNGVSEAVNHWFLRRAGTIDDRSFSTPFHKPRIVGERAEPTHLTRRQNSSDDSSTGVSAGAAAGIGIVVAIAVIVAAALAAFVYLRRRGVTLTQIRRLERQQDNRHSSFTHRRNRSNGSSMRSDRQQLRPQDSFYSSSNAEFLGTNVTPSATQASTSKAIYSNPYHNSNKELYPGGVVNAPSPSVSPFLPHPAITPPLPTAGNPIMLAEMPTGLESHGGTPSHPIGITSTTGLTSTTNLALKPLDTKSQTWNSNPWAFLPPAANGTPNPPQQQQHHGNGNTPYQHVVFEAPAYSYRSELDSSPSTPKATR
jgi:hypothetical protein